MLSSNKDSFIFAAGMCIVCSLLLTFAATNLKSRQDMNVRLDTQKNILKALGLLKDGKTYQTDDVDRIFSTTVKRYYMGDNGMLSIAPENKSDDLYLYVVEENNKIKKYAVPVKGKGLWGTIYGYLALDGNGNTIKGLAFYSHKETPGLGGEIEKPWFTRQFIGKELLNTEKKFVSVGVVKGKVKDKIQADRRQNYVDGISGATLTSQAVGDIIRNSLMKYEDVAKKLRANETVL